MSRRFPRLNFDRLEDRCNPSRAGFEHVDSHLLELLDTGASASVTRDEFHRAAVRITAADITAVLPALKALGFEAYGVVPDAYLAEGWLPISALPAAEALGDTGLLAGVLTILPGRTGIGAVTSEGADVLQSVRVNTASTPYTGSGVKVGVISDSFNNLGTAAADVASNDLPGLATPTLFALTDRPSGGTDEGRAMMQIVRDVAPGAILGFYSGTIAPGETPLVNAVNGLVAASANVIVDDINVSTEPVFQDSLVSKAYTSARGAGIVGISMAFNTANNAYQATAFPTIASGGKTWFDFNSLGGSDLTNSIVVPAKSSFSVVLQWDDPFYFSGKVKTDLDLYAYASGSSSVIVTSSVNNNVINNQPAELITLVNPGTTPFTVDLKIAYNTATSLQMPGRVFLRPDQGSPQMELAGFAAINGHNGSSDVLTVGGVNYYNQRAKYEQTALGPVVRVFDNAGNRLASPLVINKPDLAAPQGANTTFFGTDTPGPNGDPDTRPNFFGTSAAAPHAAGIAALMLQKTPGLTPAQVISGMIASAEDIESPGWDPYTGFGLLNAWTAVNGKATVAPVPAATDFESSGLGGFWEVASNFNGRVQVTNAVGGSKALVLDTFFNRTDGDSLNYAQFHINAQVAGAKFEFDARNLGDEANTSDGVFFSVNGGANYYTLLVGSSIPAAWTHYSFDLNAVAASNGVTLSSDTILRFQQKGNSSFDAATDKDGLSFDNVNVSTNGVPLADKFWDGGALNDNWSDPLNWVGNTLPTANSRVQIPAGYNVIADSGSAKSVYAYSPLTVSGSLTLTAPSHTYSSFTLAAGGQINTFSTVEMHSNMAWTGGTLSGVGSLVIAAGQTVTLSGVDPKFIETFTLNNSGTIVWTGGDIQTGSIFGQTQGGLINSGTFRIETDADWLQYGGYFTPALSLTHLPGATFVKQASNGDTLIAAALDLREAVSITSGSLRASGGGTISSFTLNGGTLDLEGGTYIPFAANNTVTGASTIRINGGTLDIPAAKSITFQNLDLLSGTVQGLGTVAVTGITHWSGGQMRELGLTRFNAGSSVFIEGTDPKFLESRFIESFGATTWSGGDFQTGCIFGQTAGGWSAKSGSQFTITGTGNWNQYGGYYTPAMPFVLNSNAQLTRASGAGTVEFQGAFTSTGKLTVTTGDISLTGGGTWGTSEINAGKVRFSNGTFNLANASTTTGNGSITIDGGIATNAVNQTASFSFLNLAPNGTLAGDGAVTITGTSQWTGGIMTGLGTTVFGAASGLSIAGVDPKYLESRNVDMSGSTTWTGGLIYSGALFGDADGSQWINRAGSQFIMTSDNDWIQFGGYYQPTASFSLQAGARLDRLSGSGSAEFQGLFNSAGKISVATGSLSLVSGGTWSSSELASGTTRFTAGTFTLNNGAAITGSGTLVLDGGTIDNGTGHAAYIDRLNLSDGTLGGKGTVYLQKNLSWTGGAMQGPGSTEFALDSIVTISGSSPKYNESRDIYNGGTVTWSSGDIQTGQTYGDPSSSWFNLNGSTLDIATDADVIQYGGYYSPALHIAMLNGSTLKKSTGAATTVLGGGLTNNGGTVRVQTGTLNAADDYIQTSGLLDVTTTFDTSNDVKVYGGLVGGIGKITSPVLLDGGTLEPGGNAIGTLTVNGDYSQAGAFSFQAAGTPTSQYDRLKVNGTATLGGPLTVNLSYGAAVGDSFLILENDGGDAISGNFQGLAQGARFSASGKLLQISYTGGTGNDVTLTVVTPPVGTVVVNGGTMQRSRLTTVTVNFTSAQSAAQFQTPGAVSYNRGGTTVDTSNGLIVSSGTGNVTSITLTFANVANSGVEYGSLADGYWRLNIPSLGYMSADNDTNLRRLFGDTNGDGTVDGPNDFSSLKFQSVANDPFDFNGDGTIDGPTDFAQFGSRFGKTI